MPTDPTSRSPRRRGRDENQQPAGGDDFWGGAGAWSDATPRRSTRPAASGGRLGRWWNSATTAGSTATRTHGSSVSASAQHDPTPAVGIDPFLDPDVDPATTRARQARRSDATAASAVAWHDQEDHAAWDVDAWETDRWDAGWDVEPAPVRRAGLDPLIARFGAVLVVITIAVPVIMGFTSGSDAGDQLREVSAAITTVASTATTEATVAPAQAEVTSESVAPTATAPKVTAAATTEAAETTAATASTDPDDATDDDADDAEAMLTATEPATTVESSTVEASVAPATTVAVCQAEYELAEGDYWIRIADAAGVRLADLLAVNGATVETVLVPGRTVCLPAGASMPSPPVAPATTQPPTTAAPTTAAPTTAAPTTAAPTTAAPTTTSPPPPVAPGDVEAIIRSVWPDDLEDHALAIAWRESNYVPTAKNYCCYGLFQIYWSVHRSWLDDFGITSAEQLYDPATNARAAYALYQRAGGFGPWGG